MYVELEVHWWLNLMGPSPFLASSAGQIVLGLWLTVVFPNILGLQEHLFSVLFASDFQLHFVVDGIILAIHNEKIIHQGILRIEVHLSNILN